MSNLQFFLQLPTIYLPPPNGIGGLHIWLAQIYPLPVSDLSNSNYLTPITHRIRPFHRELKIFCGTSGMLSSNLSPYRKLCKVVFSGRLLSRFYFSGGSGIFLLGGGGAPTPKVGGANPFFCRKLNENERIWTPGGHPWRPLGSANVICGGILKTFLIRKLPIVCRQAQILTTGRCFGR